MDRKTIDNQTIENLLIQWKEIYKNTKKYIKLSQFETDSDKELISIEKFHNAVVETYSLFLTFQSLESFPKSILILINEIKKFSCNSDIYRYGDGFLKIRTSIADALCDILIKDIVCENANILIFYMSEGFQTYDEGYYQVDIQNLNFSYIGIENPLSTRDVN